ncbi:hypothetical protein GMDG_08879, partial [Pseudogymnoascus destructans 20631-21]
MQDRSTAAFKDSLRGADMLLIDDVQFDGKKIVLSADRAPMALTEIEPRLRSHLASGLTCPVEPGRPLGVVSGEVRPEVLEHLVDRTPGSMRELEGAVNTLAAVAATRLSALTVDEAQGLLGAALRGGPERRITVDEIQKT